MIAWSKLLDRDDVLILDTETTGFRSYHEVVEVAAINTRGDILFSEMVKPVYEVEAQVTRIHGITNAMLADKPTYDRVHDRLMQVLCRATSVCAWNAPFDRRLLEQSAARYGLELPPITWRDLLSDHRALYPDYSSHKLVHVAAHRDVGEAQSHRALGDCQMTLAVVRAQA